MKKRASLQLLDWQGTPPQPASTLAKTPASSRRNPVAYPPKPSEQLLKSCPQRTHLMRRTQLPADAPENCDLLPSARASGLFEFFAESAPSCVDHRAWKQRM